MNKPLTAKDLTIIGIFTAVTTILAQIAVPLPFTPVPVSFGLIAVYMTGVLLKPNHAVLTQISYLLLGAMGVPVFGNFRGGIGALFGPTGGYLLAYPIMAGIVSLSLNSNKSREREAKYSINKKGVFLKSGVSICIAHIVLYAGGTIWYSVTTGNSIHVALALTVYPFIPLDVMKIVFCIAVLVPLRFRLLLRNLL